MRLITLDNLKHFKKKMKESIDAELSQSLVCIGTVFQYAGSIAPKGYLLCEGQAVSRIEYSNLFKIIGTIYGNGDGSTTFNLPDMRECVPVGAGTSTRTDIGTHDALELGKYRADSFASHGHSCSTADTNHKHDFSGSISTSVVQGRYASYDGGFPQVIGIQGASGGNLVNFPSLGGSCWGTTAWQSDKHSNYRHSHTIENIGGTTTHGKQVAVNYIIKY